MSDIRFFDSNDEMFNYLSEESKKIKEWAKEHNAFEIINNNDYFLSVYDDILIVGEKRSPLLLPEEYDSEEEYLWEKNMAEASKKNGYIFGKWYSVLVPYGELGDKHLSACYPIPSNIGQLILDLIITRS
jgi:hypothetical protein